MRAAWYESNGAARDVLRIGDMDVQEPGEGEVLVRMSASGVNPSDVKSRRSRPLVGPRIIPHSDGAGVIEAVGKGVARRRVGERVWLWNAQWKHPFGTAAEFCTVRDEQAVKLPVNIGFVAGACLGIPALTALHAVRLQGAVAGKTLLVTGGGSAVGHYVIQIAKIAGARVIATASDSKSLHARQAGADFVIDYKAKDVPAVVRDLTRDRGVDGMIDMDFSTGTDLLRASVMAPHGTCVCYGSNIPLDLPLNFPAMLWNSYALRFFVVYELRPADRKAAIEQLTGLLEAGSLKHAIGETFALERIADAHEAIEHGQVIGNVVLDIA